MSFLAQAADARPSQAPLHDLSPPDASSIDAAPGSIPRTDLRPRTGGDYGELDLAPSQAEPAPPAQIDVPDLILEPRSVPASVRSPVSGSTKVSSRGAEPAQASPHDSLTLDLPPSKPPQKKLRPAVGPSSFDDMEMMGGSGSIDLASHSGTSDSSDDEVPEWARPQAGAAPNRSAPPPGTPAKPISALLASEDGGHGAAVRLADYGPAPDPLWQAPLYAYRVKMRQMELHRELAERRANLDKARAAADDALLLVAERGRKLILGKDGYTKLLEQIALVEGALRERDGALAAETDTHKQRTGAIDEQRVQVEAEVKKTKAEELATRVSFERAEGVRQRAEAMLKRAEIDLRSAIARAAPPSKRSVSEGSPAATDPDVIARTAERDARLGDLQRATPAVTELGQKLTAFKRRLAADEERILTLKNERAAKDDEWRKRGAAHGAEVANAEKDVRAAMSELGRTMMGDFSMFGAEWSPARAELVELDKVTAARDDDVLLHVMALDTADAKKVQSGIVLAVGAVSALLFLFLIPIVLGILSSSKPPAPPPPSARAAPADSE